MKTVLAALIALAISSLAAAAGCLPHMTATGYSLIYDQGGAIYELDYADVPAPKNPAAPVNIRYVQETLQGLVDKRFPLIELDVDDPDRIEPQTAPNHYWSDAQGNPRSTLPGATHITERCAEITNVTWNGRDYVTTWVVVRGF